MNADFSRHLDDIATYLHSVPPEARDTAAKVLYDKLVEEYAVNGGPGPWNVFREQDSSASS